MFILNKICIKLFCKYIGKDKFGNQYYQSKKRDYLNVQKRYIIYQGTIEPSLIPPVWHAWLHYSTNEIPKQDTLNEFDWQQDYEPNKTGTKLAFDPTKNITVKTEKYIKWEPK